VSTLEISNLSVNYAGTNGQGTLALSGVNLSMKPGDFVVALGASGCGKTTCCPASPASCRPPAGRSAGGQPCSAPAPSAAWCSEARADALAVGAGQRGIGPAHARHGESRARAIAMDKLRLVRLENADCPIYQLSGGMQQRGIARALASDPAVMLMDEPLGALDALTRAHIQDLILNLWWQTKKMFFFITHSVEEALFLATELIVMTPSPGRIAHRFQPPFSKQFIDCQDSRAVKSSPAFIDMRECWR
jgi:taurine transport system ATP-binding protein